MFNRVVRWERIWELDPRHPEVMTEQMGIKGAKALEIQYIKEEKKGDRELSRYHLTSTMSLTRRTAQSDVIDNVQRES